MKKVLVLLLIMALTGCKTKTALIDNLTCGGTLEVQADRRGGTSFFPGSDFIIQENENAILFMDDFNDSIKIEINGVERYRDFVTTNKADGINNYFTYNFAASTNTTVKITSLTRNICCDFKMDIHYRFAYIYFYDNRWIVRYSNKLFSY